MTSAWPHFATHYDSTNRLRIANLIEPTMDGQKLTGEITAKPQCREGRNRWNTLGCLSVGRNRRLTLGANRGAAAVGYSELLLS